MTEGVHTMPKDSGAAMIKAAKAGDVARVQELLTQNGTLTAARDQDGSTPLHCAAWKGHVAVAEVLLVAGADVNAANQNEHGGTTPLHAAAHGNQKAVVEVLLRHGADLAAKNVHGRTPLAETGFHNASAAARLLREHGATE
jgi:ankyrin repeat protein